jgi:outer membrane immunogenic protein
MKLESLRIRAPIRAACCAAPRGTNKWSVAAAAVAALLATPVVAADFPLKAPTVPEYSWSGCYAGAQGGGTVATSDGAGFGAFVGGQFGCNYQVGHFVFGVEAEAVRSNWTGHNDEVNAGANFHETIKSPWNADVAIRGGYVFPNDVFVYLRFGAAFASFSSVTAQNPPFMPAYVTTASLTAPGYVAGFGAEVMFAPHWIARIETDVMTYVSDVTTYCTPAAACAANLVPPSSIKSGGAGALVGKLGISYKFF